MKEIKKTIIYITFLLSAPILIGLISKAVL